MSIVHHLHYYWLRFGDVVCSITIDLIAVTAAIGTGWALVPWVAPIVGRLCPFLIC